MRLKKISLYMFDGLFFWLFYGCMFLSLNKRMESNIDNPIPSYSYKSGPILIDAILVTNSL